MKKKKTNKFFWSVFLSEIALIIFFLSLCVVMYARDSKATEASREQGSIMDKVYVELPNGQQVKWAESQHVKLVIRTKVNKKPVTKLAKATSSKGRKSKHGDIEQLVVNLAEEQGFKNVWLLKKIARCESGLNPDAVNWGSLDFGLWQINLHHNPEVTRQCALDPDCATRWAIAQIEAGNVWKWNASRYCWSN